MGTASTITHVAEHLSECLEVRQCDLEGVTMTAAFESERHYPSSCKRAWQMLVEKRLQGKHLATCASLCSAYIADSVHRLMLPRCAAWTGGVDT